MYDIRKTTVDSKETYQILVNKKKVFEGNLAQCMAYGVYHLHFEANDLEDGFTEMEWMDHDTAHFGINRTFIFTRNSQEAA